ncbi:MAG: Rid family detoxifying hydrolase, partial [Flavobacteriaceae bacterium]
MSKKAIHSTQAPEAIGPYNQAILVNNMLFVSGQIPIDPKTGKLISTGRREETQRCLENIEQILKAAGFGLNHVVKSTIFLTDMNDFSLVNEVYRDFFSEVIAPARETVAVTALPA